jgi:hypothetical protein
MSLWLGTIQKVAEGLLKGPLTAAEVGSLMGN